MDDDLARKVSEIKKPSGDENEMEDYDNDVMEIKNQSVSKTFLNKLCLLYFISILGKIFC